MERNGAIHILLTWSVWLRLRHPTLTQIHLASVLLAAGLLGLLEVLPRGFNLIGDRGVAAQVNGLLQILAPFFVGALAAISSFQRDDLDRPMGGKQPTLWERGEEYPPTKREFFGYLFGYLAALSIIVYAAGAVALAVGSSGPGVQHAVAEFRASGWAQLAKGVYLVALANLGLTTFVGLHFLIIYLPAKSFKPGFHHKPPAAKAGRDFLPGEGATNVGHD